MTRVVNGIYDTCELGTGFFITDEQADIIAEWLESYASALEKAWVKKGSPGEERGQKFRKVRSFAVGIANARNNQTKKEKDNG